MRKIVKGFKLIGSGIWDAVCMVVLAIVGAIVRAVKRLVKAVRAWRLKRAVKYVERYGYSLSVNSRVKVDGKAYYVLSFETYQGYDSKREVRLNLVGVPQYREIMRRMKVL